jgi:hypothetical protein
VYADRATAACCRPARVAAGQRRRPDQGDHFLPTWPSSPTSQCGGCSTSRTVCRHLSCRVPAHS